MAGEPPSMNRASETLGRFPAHSVTQAVTRAGKPRRGSDAETPIFIGGGPCRTRTYDLLIKSQQLYQLS
jgi:hypothetical protein